METGLKFDDFEIGKEYISPRRTVTEADIQQFTGLSGDYNPLHTDDIFIQEKTNFPGRIAHGALIFAMATGLSFREGLTAGTALGFLGADLQFVHYVLPGDTIYQVSKCIEKIESRNPERGIVVFQKDIYNQKNELCMKQKSTVLVMRDKKAYTKNDDGSINRS